MTLKKFCLKGFSKIFIEKLTNFCQTGSDELSSLETRDIFIYFVCLKDVLFEICMNFFWGMCPLCPNTNPALQTD
jgi:hypothetical protein